MVFAHPTVLWLLLLAVPLAAIHSRRRMRVTAGHFVWVVGARLLAFASLVLALAGPIVERADPNQMIVAVVDLSESVSDGDLKAMETALAARLREQQAGERFRIVAFADEASVVSADWDIFTSDGLASLRDVSVDSVPGSAMAEALRLAGALIPCDGGGSVLLYSDGLATDGDASAVAYRLAERGIGVTAVPVGGPRADEVVLRSVSLPASGEIGATVEIRFDVESSEAGPATVVLRDEDSGDEEVVPLRLRAGRQRFDRPCALRREGLVRYSVRVDSDADTRSNNNALTTAIWVEPPRRITVVEEGSGSPAANALRSLLGLAADVRSMSPDALSAPESLAGAGLLVLADVPAGAIPSAVQQRIENAVVAGTGLLVSGGRRSFGPGGYARTPLADVLPVSLSQEVQRRDPSTTLVVIIDTSGSMGGARVNLAKEIARLAIARLQPHDKVGIVEFYGSKRWAAPIQPASNAIDLHRALNRLSAGGGTVILPAIEEAYYALQNVRTRTKHVLVLTDGGVETGAFEPLIRKMADKGITLSTVMVGPGGHSAFLAGLAQWGRGRFYAAPDRFNLPEIIVKQPESSLLTPFVEQPTALRGRAGVSNLEGIDLSVAPMLAGYVQTRSRPTADVLLESSLGHPVLVRWRYGLGAVAAYTTHLGGDWTADFAAWRPYSRLMARLVRSLCATRADEALRVRPVWRRGALELAIENRVPGSGSRSAEVALTIANESGVVDRQVLDPVSPDQWNTRLGQYPPGVYRVDVRTLDGRLAGAAAFAVPPVREVPALAADRARLAATEWFRSRAAERAAELASLARTRPAEAWPIFVAASLLLLLLNILLRRLPLGGRGARPSGASAAAGLVVGLIGCGTINADVPDPDARRALQAALAAESWDDTERHFAEACAATRRESGELDGLIAYLQEQEAAGVRGRRLVARAAQRNGMIALAASTLDSMRDARSSDPVFWSELGQVEEWRGDDDSSLASLDKGIALARDPERRFALQVRRVLILQGRDGHTAAADAIRALAGEHRDDPGIQLFCAVVAGLTGDNETALLLLRPGGTAKQRFQAHLFRGLYLSRLGRFGEAGREFEQAYPLGPLSRDRRFALDCMVTSARAAGNLSALADRWLALGQRGRAGQRVSPEILQSLVVVLRELERPDDALALLRRSDLTDAQRQLIESPGFQSDVIATAVEAGRLSEAEAAFRSQVDREPDLAEWRVGLARLLLLDGRRDEAVGLFDDGIARFERARPLWGLADGARRLGLDEVALRAARKVGGCEGARIRAILFEADLLRERGDADAAIALLKKTVGEGGADPDVLLAVAEALERYGDTQEALALFRSLYDETGSEDVLLRVAWLLEENGRFGDAYDLWLEMWRTTQVAARMRQAQQRVLDLASRTGRLADLAIELEERLDSEDVAPDDRELSLLVDIYTLANDPVSAAEILVANGRRGEPDAESVDLYKRLVQIHLSCEQFGRCNRLLRQLIELDPDNADEYLQQLAVIALERRQPYQAKAALRELAARSTDDGLVAEFSAGVLGMVGLHDEAARAYGRVLARHPDRIEAFLTWGNAMRAAGRGDQAVGRFQLLLDEAAEDDLFAVAVDGLLNLDAKPSALRSAYRRVEARIAARPDKVFLYRLGADLLDALGDREGRDALLEQAVMVAGERRGSLLRELMDSAFADNRTERMIRFGRSLLAMDEQMPPQVYLDLGEALIKTGRLAPAERVFARASIGADFASVRQRVATFYEEANQPAEAERMIRELLAGEPDNVPLLIRSGGLCEQLGAYARGFEQYGRAADLMLRRLPRVVRRDARPEPPESTDPRPGRRRRWRAANLDEVAQYFDSAANGLLNAARTPDMRGRLIDELVARVAHEMDELTTEESWAPSIEGNVRLDHLARFVRHVAFSLRRPDVADALDRQLVVRYANDPALRSKIVQSRLTWGLYARAAAFSDSGERAGIEPSILLTIRAVLSGAVPLDKLISENGIDTPLARRLVPALIMLGQDDAALRLLHVMGSGPPSELGETASTMLAAAIALDDDDALRRWATLWLDGSARLQNGEAIAASVERCLRVSWNHLRPGDREVLLQRVDRLAATLAVDDRLAVDLLRLRLAAATGQPFEERARVLLDAARDEDRPVVEMASLLATAPEADRPGLVRIMAGARKPSRVRTFLMDLVGAYHGPADAQLADTVESLFRAAAPTKFRTDRLYSDVCRGGWHRNPDQPELGRRIGEILLSERPNEVEVLTAVAGARANAGAYDASMLLVTEAVDLLLATSDPEFAQARMWGDLARIMPSADRDELITDLRDRVDIEGATPSLLYAQGVLLEASRRLDEATAAYTAAFHLSPDNRTLSRKVIRLLKRGGRARELARSLSAHLTKSSVLQSFEWRTLVGLYRDLYDLAAAAEAARRLEGPLSPIEQMSVLRMMGRAADVRDTFLRFLITNRNQGRFYNPFWPDPPSPGGMEAHLRQSARSREQRPTMFTGIADLRFASGAFEAMLRAAPPDRRDVPGLINGLVAASRDRTGRERLVSSLDAAHRDDAVTATDRRVLLALLEADVGAVPAHLPAMLEGLPACLNATNRNDRETLWTLARTYSAGGQPERARNILRWLVAYDLLTGRTTTQLRQRLERLDEYLSTVPAVDRDAERNRWTARLAMTPLDSVSGEFVSAFLDRVAVTGDADALASAVVELRERIAADPSIGSVTVHGAIARCEAAAGHFDGFCAAVDASLGAVNDHGGWTAVPVDCSTMLPAPRALADPARYVDAIVKAVESEVDSGRLDSGVAIRGLCLLGRWCFDHALSGCAESILRRVQPLSDGPGEHLLWIADLARSVGQEADATQIEVDLLRADRLPVARVPRLLDDLVAAQRAVQADALAVHAAAYSDHPAILRRAARAAQVAGDAAAAAEYRRRLAAVLPDAATGTDSSPP